jgi:hypothetical protein
MKFLCGLYAEYCPMKEGISGKGRWLHSKVHQMLPTTVVTMCIVAIGFYIRFVVALWRERKPRPSGHWVRLRLNSQTGPVVELRSRSKEASPGLAA